MFFFILFLREKGLQSGANPSKLNITPGMWIMLTLIPERNFMSTGCVMKDLLHGFEEYLKSEKAPPPIRWRLICVMCGLFCRTAG